jgi:hypothetical protein
MLYNAGLSAAVDYIVKGRDIVIHSLTSWFGLLVLIVVFPVIYGLDPLYSSDQNDKFLHGLAASRVGYLNEDWIVNTPDPFVAFSALVAVTSDIHAGLFYLYFAALIGVYAWSLVSIVTSTVEVARNGASVTLFVLGMLTLHSTLLGEYQLGAEDLRYLFTGGVANKGMFHSYLTPDTFSVFILFSIALYLRGYAYLAVVANAIACTFHAHYFITAALITLAYLWLDWRHKKSFSSVLSLGGVGLILVVPSMAYNLLHFAPTATAMHERALFIFNHLRISHHTDPQKWLNGFAVFKTILVMVVFVLLRRTKLVAILTPLFAVTLLLTVGQLVQASEDLAYLLPWRNMAFLVPVAVMILLGIGACAVGDALSNRMRRILPVAAVVWLVNLVIAGAPNVLAIANTKEPYVSNALRPLVEYVREHRKSGQVYLIPLRMDRFRLAAGVPVFVDWKTVPFGDVAVLEWYRRYQLADSFYKSPPHRQWAMLEKLTKEEGITHVVLPSKTVADLQSRSEVQEAFRSQSYTLYEIGPY